ncbi:MAG TPA: TrkA family potassium uptake protein [Acidimicrobiales bacterium]|jgi:trk system potassium uptake protein|nr:TrkA family potassium uptake protein [Acidimicrobiales bacterium]
MHVVIVGCGRVGSGLARIIEEQGHSVAVVDKDPKAFQRLDEGFAGTQIVGVGFDRDTLEEAGIREAGAIAAVTSGDNSNILTARVARETFGIERVVARIYDPRRAVIYERLGIPTIATVQWTIDRTLRKLLPDASENDWVDPSAHVVVVERPVAPSWAGQPLTAIDIPGVSRAVAVSRMGTAQVATPDLVTQDGDVVYLAVAVGHLEEVDKHLAGATG